MAEWIQAFGNEVTIDLVQLLMKAWLLHHLPKLCLLLGGKVRVRHPPSHTGDLRDTNAAQVRALDGRRVGSRGLFAVAGRANLEDAVGADDGARLDAPDEVTVE